MISWMQKHRKYLVVTIWVSTIAFIGSGAVGWGAYKYGGGSSDSIARVGDREISKKDLQTTVNNIFNYYNSLFGGKLTREQAKAMHIQEQAMQKLINDALLLNYADELGIVALDDEVIKEYTSIDAFKVDGKFSKSRLDQILRAQGISKKEFENNIKKSVILKKLTDALSLPQTPLEDESIYAGKELSDHIIIKKITKDPSAIKVSDKEIKEYWQSHKDNYKSKTSYTLETIKVPSSNISIDHKELKEFYEKNRFEYKDKDGKIRSFESAKDDIKKDLQLKKSKTQALKKYLAFKKGKIKADKEVTFDASNATFNLQELAGLKSGEFIKSIKVQDGWLTGKIKSINTPKPLEFEKAKELVRVDLQNKKALKELQKSAKEVAKSDLSDGKDLGFISASNRGKIDGLSKEEASRLLEAIFKNSKDSYVINGNNAIVYKIKEQRLFNKDNFTKEKKKLEKNLLSLKRDLIKQGLIKKLKSRYKIEQLVKFSNKKEG